jgi:hypothetical protein
MRKSKGQKNKAADSIPLGKAPRASMYIYISSTSLTSSKGNVSTSLSQRHKIHTSEYHTQGKHLTHLPLFFSSSFSWRHCHWNYAVLHEKIMAGSQVKIMHPPRLQSLQDPRASALPWPGDGASRLGWTIGRVHLHPGRTWHPCTGPASPSLHRSTKHNNVSA